MTTPRDRLSAIRHGNLPFHNPLDPAVVDEVLDVAGLQAGDRAVDLGCGPGELLVRLAERTGCGGLGVDLAAAQIEEARRRAAARAPKAALEFRAVDAGEVEGEFALSACVGSTHALGGLDVALARMAELTRPGGHVLVGDGFWAREPTDAYLEALGGASRDELPDFAALVRAGERHGLSAVYVRVASEADWERYEWTLTANGERFLAEHAGAAEADDLREWVDASRDRILTPGGRDTMGFALVLLRLGVSASSG
jgi:cyclopropane fatty-acyl-phospholipid synthase-like methyltransferase